MRVAHVNVTVQLTTIVSPAAREPSHSITASPAGSTPQFASVALLVPAGLPVPDRVGPEVIDIEDRFISPVSTIVGMFPAATGSTARRVATQVTEPSRFTVVAEADFVSVVSGATTHVVTSDETSLDADGAFDRSGDPVTVPSAKEDAPIWASLL